MITVKQMKQSAENYRNNLTARLIYKLPANGQDFLRELDNYAIGVIDNNLPLIQISTINLLLMATVQVEDDETQ